MCGIAGFHGRHDHNLAVQMVDEMHRKLAHRGPDGHGIVVDNETIHGHTRLALNDLSIGAAQPMKTYGGRRESVLSFNGEIWDHQQLRLEYLPEVKNWGSSGDTATLGKMLHHFGTGILPEIDGMFAFCFSHAGGAFLVRDRFGKIPIYIGKIEEHFATGIIWASERKAFPRGIKPLSVPPGHLINLNTGKLQQWYAVPTDGPELQPAEIVSHLRTATERRMQADAAVCCLISGGLDSAMILSLVRETRPDVEAFTVKFDEDSEDLAAARRLCSELSVPLIEVEVDLTPEHFEDALEAIEISSKAQIEIAAMCLPLAKSISERGFKACLSGEAADELFGGYGNFCIAASKQSPAAVRKLRREQLSKMARGNFIRCNKAFMAHSVECRLPFMQKELVEAAMQQSLSSSPGGKRLLKEAAVGIVPDWVIKRKKETFQGATGSAAQAAQFFASPVKYYNAELRKRFGYLPKD